MQNLPNNHFFPPKSFPSVMAFFGHALIRSAFALLVAVVTLTAQAQVAPAPSTGAGTSTGPTTQPSAQPGRSTALPQGVNNLPPAAQQQIQQQLQQRAAQQGRAAGTNGTGAATNERGTSPALNAVDTLTSKEAGDGVNSIPTNAIDTYEANRRRQLEEQRRKLFGYTIFNDPTIRASFEPNENIATPRNYVVGPGDQLNIRLYGYTEVDLSQKVTPEGTIYFANQTGIGPVSVLGLTVEQAKARIESRLATRYAGLRNSQFGPKNTFLEVSLGGIRSIRVTVTGDAIKPGTYTLSSLATVMNAIYRAGGPNENGSFRRVQLIRNNRVAATLDLYDYLLNGTQRNDFRLQDNDNIRFTTYLSRIEISGSVKRQFIFEMLPGETLDRLLFYAGDFTADAYKNRLKVTRLTDRERKVIDVTTSEYKTFVMQDGDFVRVDQLLDRFENQVTIEGAVFRPGQYSLDQSKTLRQLIQSAEGLKGDAFTGRINIVRTREDLSIENININLANVLAGIDPDPVLQREDQVIISSRFDLAEPATISVQGEVNRPQDALPYMANMTLNDALLRSGGLRESAAASQVEVVRRRRDVDPRSASAQLAEVKRFSVNRDLSISGDENRFLLQPYDQIFVRRSPNYAEQTFAVVDGEVIMPGTYAIQSKDMKISNLVAAAGGITPQAYVEGATLVRIVRRTQEEIDREEATIRDAADAASNAGRVTVETETVSPEKPEAIGINLKKILAQPGSSEDILVQQGDILRIPKILETVRIQGEVLQPTTVKFRTGQTFQDYISQAGGFTTKSQRRKAFIVYANGSVDRTRKFMFFNVYPRVAPGAQVFIPKRTTTPLTPQQVLGQTTAIAGSLLTLITTILVISRVR